MFYANYLKLISFVEEKYNVELKRLKALYILSSFGTKSI